MRHSNSLIYKKFIQSFIVLFLVFTGFAKADITTGLVAHYEFEGNSNDSAGGDNSGTDSNVTYTTGKFGQAASFNGTSSKIDISSTTGFPDTPNGGAYTLSAWINTTQLSRQAIIGWGSWATNEMNVFRVGDGISSDGYLLNYWLTNDIVYQTAFSTNSWHHAVVTYDGTNRVMYLDGVEIASTTATGLIAPLSNARIGTTYFTQASAEDNFFDGLMDDVRVYNRGLTATDVTELYNYNIITVTSTADSGAGTLRQAVLDANSSDKIVFDNSIAGQSITFSTEIPIDKNLIIESYNTNSIIFDGNASTRLFNITNSAVTFQNIIFKNGGNTNAGGAINVSNSAAGQDINITKCHFQDNTSTSDGGAIKFDGSGYSAYIDSSSFVNNSAAQKGGAIGGWPTANINVKNSTFYGNSATSVQGGAISVEGSTYSINSSTFVDNIAPSGNSVFVQSGSLSVKNSAFFNSDTAKSPIGGGATSQGYNFISNTTSATISPSTADQFHTDGTNPNLGVLTQDSGGVTFRYPLVLGSSLIDMGTCSTSTDQFGTSRPQGGSCDIGAIEYVTPPKLTLKAHGGAVQFDGVLGNKINIGDITELNGASQFTLETWVNVSQITGVDQYFFSKQSDTNNRINLVIDSTGRFAIANANGANQYTYSTNTLNSNQWYHVAFVYNGSGATLNDGFKLYINGNLETNFGSSGTSPTTSSSSLSGVNAYLGSSNISSKVSLDEFRIWSTTRTAAEISATMNQQLDGNETGLVSYYNFDERVGDTVKDITSNGYDGTIEGNVTRLNFLGDGLSFNGTDDVVVSSGNDLTSNFTISGWMKADTTQNDNEPELVSKYGISNGYKIYLDTSSGAISSSIRNSSATNSNLAGTKDVRDNKWHHFSVVYSGVSHTIYLDGNVEANTSISIDNLGSSGGILSFGGEDGGISSFKGSLAQISIFTYGKSQTEIQNLMHSSLKGDETNLVGYWPLNEGDGTILYDRTGSNNGTITSPTWLDTAPTIYGDTIYTDYGINSWQKLVVENNTTTPIYGLTTSEVSQLNTSSGLFLLSSASGDTTLSASDSANGINITLNVDSLTDAATNTNCYDPTNIGKIGTGTQCSGKLIVDRTTLDTMISAGDDITNVFTGQITDMSSLFLNNSTFNQDISGWNTSSVTDMSWMLNGATAFNQDISTWDTSSVTTMDNMLNGATLFSQNLNSWCVTNIVSIPTGFDTGSAFVGQTSLQPYWGYCPISGATTGNDTLTGTSANEIFNGGLGDDTIDGGAGIDIAVFSGNQSAYTVVDNGDGTYTVTGADGTDTLTNIEKLSFDDIQNVSIESIAIPQGYHIPEMHFKIDSNEYINATPLSLSDNNISSFYFLQTYQDYNQTQVVRPEKVVFGDSKVYSVNLELNLGDPIIQDIDYMVDDYDTTTNIINFKENDIVVGESKLHSILNYSELDTLYTNNTDLNFTIAFPANAQGYEIYDKQLATSCYVWSDNNIEQHNITSKVDLRYTFILGNQDNNVFQYNQYNTSKGLVFANNATNDIYEVDSTDQSYINNVGTYEELTSQQCIDELNDNILFSSSSIIKLNINVDGYENRALIRNSNGTYSSGEYIEAGYTGKTYSLNQVAKTYLSNAIGLNTTPLLPYSLEYDWNYVSLPTNNTLCIDAYKTVLPDICDQSKSIEDIFNQTNISVFKYNGNSWSHFTTNSSKTYNIDKLSTITQKDGLIIYTPYKTTLNFPFELDNFKLSSFNIYEKGWHLVGNQFKRSASKIADIVGFQQDNSNNNFTLKYILNQTKNTNETAPSWKVYAPLNDSDIDSSLGRIEYVEPMEAFWIYVE